MARRRAKTDLTKVDRKSLMEVLESRKHQLMSIDKIVPNPWNKNKLGADHFAALKANLANPAVGFTIPILVMEHPDGEQLGYLDTYMVVDGEHRYKAAKEIGYSKIPVVILKDISVAQAKYLTIESNAVHGVTSDSDIKKILQTIQESEEEWLSTLDIHAAVCIEEAVEEDNSKYNLDEDELDVTKVETTSVSLFFNESQIDTYRRIIGQIRLKKGVSAEVAVLECVEFYQRNQE